MKRVLVLLVVGTIVSGAAAVYASSVSSPAEAAAPKP